MNPLALLGWQRYALYGVVAALLLAFAWFHGYTRGEIKLFEYQAEQARAAVPVVIKQGAVTEKVVTRWRTKLVEVKGATETITKEIVRYVPPSADPVLPLGWWLLHDAAALGTVPPPAGGIDVASPGLAASQALEGVVGNYGACHETALQLAALQAWVRQQYETANQAPLGY